MMSVVDKCSLTTIASYTAIVRFPGNHIVDRHDRRLRHTSSVDPSV